jgi:hypothetical protein
VLVFDETITGFRWHAGGAQKLYGVVPDLSAFGKAMANGFSLAALCGPRGAHGARRAAARQGACVPAVDHPRRGDSHPGSRDRDHARLPRRGRRRNAAPAGREAARRDSPRRHASSASSATSRSSGATATSSTPRGRRTGTAVAGVPHARSSRRRSVAEC